MRRSEAALPSGKDESSLLEGRFIGKSCALMRPTARPKNVSRRRIVSDRCYCPGAGGMGKGGVVPDKARTAKLLKERWVKECSQGGNMEPYVNGKTELPRLGYINTAPTYSCLYIVTCLFRGFDISCPLLRCANRVWQIPSQAPLPWGIFYLAYRSKQESRRRS
ncbi:hypothetical protein VUR80DRAFT_4977 [Thermomyces stellatus]